MYAKYKKTRKDNEVENKILRGDLEVSRSLETRALKVFVSSTFTDTKGERNYLMRKTFPALRDFCASRGITFSVVDFRWGIRDFATNDHMTTDICMKEIDKCFDDSICAPCFIFLSFNRYGWNPLPRTVDAVEMESIMADITSADNRKLVERWYKRDDNASPPEYVLETIDTHLKYFTDPLADVGTRKKTRFEWSEIEAALQRTLNTTAVNSSKISDEAKVKWRISVTEMEVRRGILDRADPDRCLCIIRDIHDFDDVTKLDPKHKRMIGRHIELESGDGVRVDRNVQNKIRILRQEVRKSGVRCEEFKVKWAENGIMEDTHAHYMQEVDDLVYRVLKEGIERYLSESPRLGALTSEVTSHSAFCVKRFAEFTGRQGLVDTCMTYLRHPAQRPLVIHGESGVGKTSLMSAVTARWHHENDGVIITRFCGTTPSSSSIIPLLTYVCEQIHRAFGCHGNEEMLEDVTSLRRVFLQALGLATPSRPLVVVLDSLDQLEDEGRGRTQPAWVPLSLPPHTHLLLSTLTSGGGSMIGLQAVGITQDCFLQVSPLERKDAKHMLESWLGNKGRTMQESQMAKVIASATDSIHEDATPLKLRLIFNMILKLKSYQQVPRMPGNVDELVTRYLSQLEVVHGELLVSRLFGLLAVSRFGLSEEVLNDVLCGDEEVMDSILQYHKPPIRRIPQVVIARLRYDLGEYIAERGAFGTTVWTWYHRQFREAAQRKYAAGNYYTDLDPGYRAKQRAMGKAEMLKKYQHAEKLLEYYCGNLIKKYPDRGITPQPIYWIDNRNENNVRFNRHRLCEEPNAALVKDKYGTQNSRRVLCDFRFLSAKCAAGMSRDLLNDFYLAKQTPGCDEKVVQYGRFMSVNIHLYEKHPELVLQDALNQDGDSVVKTDAEALIGSATPWIPEGQMMLINQTGSSGTNACLLTIKAHTSRISDILLLPEVGPMCDTKYIVTASFDGEVPDYE